MRHSTLTIHGLAWRWLVLAVLLISPLAARAQTETAWIAPVRITNISASYFDPAYARTERRQHLGVDLPAQAGTEVRSPATGMVVINDTAGPNVMEAYLIIREIGSGAEHVLGHVASNLTAGQPVSRGAVIGTVRAWPNQPARSHVHWGVNARWVPRPITSPGIEQVTPPPTGWGRAPLSVSRARAAELEWIDISPFIARREHISIGADGVDLVPHPSFTMRGQCGDTTRIGMAMNVEYSNLSYDVADFIANPGRQAVYECNFFFYADPQITQAAAQEIDWARLRSIPGLRAYSATYADPNEIWLRVWGNFDAERVVAFMTGASGSVRLRVARRCCIPTQ